MLLILAFLSSIYLLFRFHREGQLLGLNRILAVLFFLVYGVSYLYIPPFIGMHNQYAGKMYELVPIVCYFLVLLPEMEYAETGEKAIAFYGWFGLIFITTCLAYFKLYVW